MAYASKTNLLQEKNKMAESFKMPSASGGGLEIRRYENDVIFLVSDVLDPKLGAEYMLNFEYRPGDILLCSHPKSGTHWMGNMIWKLKTLDESKRMKMTVVEFRESEFYDNQDSPRVMFTHMRPSRFAKQHLENKGKIVLMVRNPKDLCVSLYNHMKNATLVQNKQTWDEFFMCFILGIIPYSSYLDFLKEWDTILQAKAKGDDTYDVEVFYYEDFQMNPAENVARLNKFLGFNRDQAYIDKVLEETSFKSMLKGDTDAMDKVNEWARDSEGGSVIFRKGVVGDWKNYFSDVQSEIMDTYIREKMEYKYFNFRYEI